MPRSANLVHYTTVAGAFGILETDSLYATNAFFLNDTSEIVHARHVISDALIKRLAEITKTKLDEGKRASDLMFGCFALCDLCFDEDDEKHSYDRFVPFVVCFCKSTPETYKDGLLSQWRGYGSSAAVALEFDGLKLSALLEQQHFQEQLGPAELEHVEYFDQKHSHRRMVQSAIRKLNPALADVSSYFRSKRLTFNRLLDWYYTKARGMRLQAQMLRFACFVKNSSFKEEQEVRLAVYIADNEPKNRILHRMRGSSLIPYIAISAVSGGRLPIRRILIGPQKDQQRLKRAFESVVRSKSINSIVVDVSGIPLQSL